jgi:hypothetical protein
LASFSILHGNLIWEISFGKKSVWLMVGELGALRKIFACGSRLPGILNPTPTTSGCLARKSCVMAKMSLASSLADEGV